MKPTLFFDFDDVCVNHIDMLRVFIFQQFGVEIPAGHFICGNSIGKIVADLLPPDRKITSNRFYEVWATKGVISHELHAGVTPIPGALKYLPKLADKYDIWILTARMEDGRAVVERLCQKFFAGHISGFHFVWKRFGVEDFRQVKSKRDFIKDFSGVKVAFFDDNPGEIRAVQDILPAFLFDPHRVHLEEKDIKLRVSSWREISDLLL
jgi:5'(3')-deoxyribonucleotidase